MSNASEPSQYGIVFVTAASQEEARAIATALIQNHLAACVSFAPIRSMYTWQGEVHDSEEWQLWIKSDLHCFEALAAMVRQVHSYEVPEIIALPIVAGSPPYLQWISEQLTERLG
jgi:periplasmic divalent cation tolerance protein